MSAGIHQKVNLWIFKHNAEEQKKDETPLSKRETWHWTAGWAWLYNGSYCDAKCASRWFQTDLAHNTIKQHQINRHLKVGQRQSGKKKGNQTAITIQTLYWGMREVSLHVCVVCMCMWIYAACVFVVVFVMVGDELCSSPEPIIKEAVKWNEQRRRSRLSTQISACVCWPETPTWAHRLFWTGTKAHWWGEHRPSPGGPGRPAQESRWAWMDQYGPSSSFKSDANTIPRNWSYSECSTE